MARKKRWGAIPQDICDRVRVLRSCGHDQATVGELTGLHFTEVSKIEARGYKAATAGRSVRPIPDDFPFYVHEETIDELCSRYTAGTSTVIRWRREYVAKTGQTLPDRRGWRGLADYRRRDPPPDLLDHVDRENMAQLRARYRCANATIHGWLKQLGREYRPKFEAWNKREGKAA